MSWPNEQNNPAAAIPVYVVPNSAGMSYNIGANGSAQVWPLSGVLTGVTVGTGGTTSTLSLYEGTSNAGRLLATIDTSTQVSLTFNAPFTGGLFAEAAGAVAANSTVSFTR